MRKVLLKTECLSAYIQFEVKVHGGNIKSAGMSRLIPTGYRAHAHYWLPGHEGRHISAIGTFETTMSSR